MTPSVRFPLLAGGTAGAWFPSQSGGNPKEGGVVEEIGYSPAVSVSSKATDR